MVYNKKYLVNKNEQMINKAPTQIIKHIDRSTATKSMPNEEKASFKMVGNFVVFYSSLSQLFPSMAEFGFGGNSSRVPSSLPETRESKADEICNMITCLVVASVIGLYVT